jgi:hypothetical protein
MTQLNLKPTHKAVQAYYRELDQLSLLHASDEGAVRSAFQSLLGTCASQLHWTLRTEYPIRRRNQASLRVDAALFDDSRLVRGMWEAKDEHDDLEKEVRRKLSLGYPDNNILFQAPQQVILVQGGAIRHKEDISKPDALVHVVRHLFEYRTPEIERWEDAVAHFREEVPEQARALKELIDREHAKNSAFREAFGAFAETCRAWRMKRSSAC